MNPEDVAQSTDRGELAALLDAAVDAIVIIDEQGRILRFSRAAERIFGHDAADMVGRDVSCLMPDDHRAHHAEYVRQYIETGRAKIIGIGREVMAVRRDGTSFPVELSIGEAKMPNGDRHFVGIIRDISDRRRDAAEIRRQRDALAHVDRIGTMGELTTSIAHEVNQPLAAISTYAQTLLRLLDAKKLPTPRLRDVLTDIAQEAARAGDIIHRLRRLIRRQGAEPEPCDVNAVIAEIWRLAQMDANHHDVPLTKQTAESLPLVSADRIQIQQVVINLIRNAVDATRPLTPPYPPVLLETRYDAHRDRIVITVTDRGVGVGDPNALFETFVSTKPDGIGLGLPISRHIAEAHGGHLWYEPAHPGSHFHFSIPAAKGGDA